MTAAKPQKLRGAEAAASASWIMRQHGGGMAAARGAATRRRVADRSAVAGAGLAIAVAPSAVTPPPPGGDRGTAISWRRRATGRRHSCETGIFAFGSFAIGIFRRNS